MSEHTAEIAQVHQPRCNTYCAPGSHHLTSGIGYPHLHRTDLAGECGECVLPPRCDNYAAPLTCLTTGCTTPCDRCRDAARVGCGGTTDWCLAPNGVECAQHDENGDRRG